MTWSYKMISEENIKFVNTLGEITEEFLSATNKFEKFNSAHEGYAILLEEVDELWDNVKLNQDTVDRTEMIKHETIQVAAMAIRLLYDCC